MRTFHRAAVALAASVALSACDVTLPWTSEPAGGGISFDVTPASLAFTAEAGGATPAAQQITVTSHGGVVYIAVTHTAPVAAATFSTTTGKVTVTVAAPTAAGTTTGSVLVHGYLDAAGSREVAGSPKSVSVSYAVGPSTAPAISVATASLQFSAVAGRTAPAPQTFDVSIANGPVTLQLVPSGAAVASATILSQSATSATVQVTAPAPGAWAATLSGSVQVRGCVDVACTRQVSGSPRSVPVSYAVTSSQLAAAPTTLSFTAVGGAGPSAAQTLDISDPNGTAAWSTSVAYGAGATGWLTVSPSGGADLPAASSVTVSFPESTTAMTYGATLTVTSLGASRTVTVSATVSRPRVLASPATLSFSAVRDQAPLPASQPIDLSTEHGGTLGYTTQVTYGAGASGWLSVPASGTAPGSLVAAVTTDGLPPGHYTATLRVVPSNGAADTLVAVAYDVAAPALSVAPAALAFTVNATTTAAETAQSASLGDGGTPLTWTATASQPWLEVVPASGSTPATPTVRLVLSQLETLAPGAQSAYVTFTYDVGPGTTAAVTALVDLALNLPMIETVMPEVSVAGIGGEVTIRGRGFPSPLSTPVLFGPTQAESAASAFATEARATPPTTLTSGSYLVTLQNALGLSRSSATLEVVDVAVRGAASVPSPGAKPRIVYDDLRAALYVANAGAGRIDRHRAAASWAKAADGSDEIALPGVKNIALSPDGATLLAIAGTTFRLVDVATFALRATQPTAVAPLDGGVGLEMTNAGKAVYLPTTQVWNAPWVFDLGTSTTSLPTLAGNYYGGRIVGSANGAQVALFGPAGMTPPEGLMFFDAVSGGMVSASIAPDGDFGALDRTAARLVVFGTYDATLGRYESRYFWHYALVAPIGTLPPRYAGAPPNKALPATLAVALSPLGRPRAYTWDGTAVRCFDLDGALDTFGVYPLLFSVTPAAAPGANARLALAADERTAFLAGDTNVVFVPLP